MSNISLKNILETLIFWVKGTEVSYGFKRFLQCYLFTYSFSYYTGTEFHLLSKNYNGSFGPNSCSGRFFFLGGDSLDYWDHNAEFSQAPWPNTIFLPV